MVYNETNYYCSCKVGYYSISQLPETQLQSDSHCQRGQVYTGSLLIVGTFNQDLNDTNSTTYKTLQQSVIDTLTATLKSSPATKSIFERVVVTGFKAGSIIAEYFLIFKQNAIVNQLQLANIISTSNYTIQGQPMQNVTVNDFNECSRMADNTCNSSQNCINLPGTYTCRCKPGYTGSSCVDINECAASQVCANNAICSNTLGSYSCNCQVGYQGNPYSDPGCSEACNSTYCFNGGTCIYTNSQRKCSCDQAYTGIRCDKLRLQQATIIGISAGSVAAIIFLVLIPVLYYLSMRARRRNKNSTLISDAINPAFDNTKDKLSYSNSNMELKSPLQESAEDANVNIAVNTKNSSAF